MEFKFKRKYTFFFIFALVLHIGLLAFWVFTPQNFFNSAEEKQTICLLVLVNIELISLLYIGLFRKKICAYHDKIVVKRALLSDILISYKDIIQIKENTTDAVLLGFGNRPSFTVYYQKGKRKKYTLRADNNNLLLKIVKNEIDISKLNNNDKKLTK